ncbi:four helix bundle protein [Sediminibacterium roseum]|nr:four helix bundle protein [Sediminibacterium roseum]
MVRVGRYNAVKEKSYLFSLRIIKLYRHLRDKKEFQLANQVLRSGTSIGANVEEGLGGSSRKDFKAKLDIAYREARETNYWIRLLKDAGIIEQRLANSFQEQCEELLKLLSSILNTLKLNTQTIRHSETTQNNDEKPRT